jgi:hypothetical protein|tara:strand:+ start:921 stop:1229 length:309 start_codon:yes stop_codon:yes gene_type:complete
MAIKPPSWASSSTPTTRGWIDPVTGELLKSQRITSGEIEDYLGVSQVTEQVVHQAPQMLHEAPVGNVGLSSMTKPQLVALAEQSGVEVRTWDSKKTLIEKLS